MLNKLTLSKEDLKNSREYEVEIPVKIKLHKNDVEQLLTKKKLYWLVDECIKIEVK